MLAWVSAVVSGVWAAAMTAKVSMATGNRIGLEGSTATPSRGWRELFSLRPRETLVGDRRVVGEGGHHQSSLPNVVHAQPVSGVHVRVMGSHIVVGVVLNRIESGYAGGNERQVIGAADRLESVPARSIFLQRFQPSVKNLLYGFVALSEPAIDWAGAIVDIEIHVQLA